MSERIPCSRVIAWPLMHCVLLQAHIERGSASSTEIERQARDENERLKQRVRDLELDLAQTKLKLVESECKVQVSKLVVDDNSAHEACSFCHKCHTNNKHMAARRIPICN